MLGDSGAAVMLPPAGHVGISLSIALAEVEQGERGKHIEYKLTIRPVDKQRFESYIRMYFSYRT